MLSIQKKNNVIHNIYLYYVPIALPTPCFWSITDFILTIARRQNVYYLYNRNIFKCSTLMLYNRV